MLSTILQPLQGWARLVSFQRLMPSPNTTAYCLLPTAYGVGLVWCQSSTILQPYRVGSCIHMSSTILQPLQGWVMYPLCPYPTLCLIYNSQPYRVGSCIHMSSTILQPLQGWVLYPHVVYNSHTLGHVPIHMSSPRVGLVGANHLQSTILHPTGLGWFGAVHLQFFNPYRVGLVSNHLQFFNPYRVGSGWFPFQRLMPSPNTTAYCLLPTTYCLLPTAYCYYLLLLPTAYCLLPYAYFDYICAK